MKTVIYWICSGCEMIFTAIALIGVGFYSDTTWPIWFLIVAMILASFRFFTEGDTHEKD